MFIKKRKNERKFLAAFFFLLFVLLLSQPVASSDPDKIRIWGFHKGSGEEVAQNTCKGQSTCKLKNFDKAHHCEYEGDYYIDAKADGVTDWVGTGKEFAYTVNYDNSKEACMCESNDNKWGINFGSGTNGKCCGDDSGENYIEGGDGSKACCNNNANTVFEGECYKVEASNAYFENLNGKKIGEDEISGESLEGENVGGAQINDTVRLVVEGNWPKGAVITYSIDGEDIGSITAQSQSRESTTWIPRQEGLYEFSAKVGDDSISLSGDKGEVKSGTLNVTGPSRNTVPKTNITSPNEGIHFVDEELNFAHETSDPDDQISKIRWEFGGKVKLNNGEEVSHIEMTENFNKVVNASYISGGIKDIKIIVEDSREVVSTDEISISVAPINRRSIFSRIDSPIDEETIQFKFVVFNGSSSYAINVEENSGDISIQCLGGKCPTETEGCPPGYDESNCPININKKGNYKDYSNIMFNWTFFEGEKSNKIKIGSNSAKGEEGKSIGRYFGNNGYHYVRLEVSYNSVSSKNGNNFFVQGMEIVPDPDDPEVDVKEGRCIEDGKKWKKESPEGVSSSDLIIKTTDTGACGKYDKNCCPPGYSCQNSSEYDSGKTCKLIPTEICGNKTTCSDYKTKDACTNNNCNLGMEGSPDWEGQQCSEGTGEDNDHITVCNEGCEWDNEDNECSFEAYIVPNGTEDPGTDGPPGAGEEGGPIYKCTLSTESSGSCDEDTSFVNMNYNFVLENVSSGNIINDKNIKENENCISKERSLPCPEKAKVPFFGLYGIIVVIIILIIIYYFWFIRPSSAKKTKKNKKK